MTASATQEDEDMELLQVLPCFAAVGYGTVLLLIMLVTLVSERLGSLLDSRIGRAWLRLTRHHRRP